MGKKTLLIGSSYSAAPILFALKRRNMHVAVCGSLEDDPCHQYADASYFFDYSDKYKLLSFVQENQIDFIVPTCNDYSFLASSWVAEKLGKPGFDKYATTKILHNKSDFRLFTAANKLPAPRAIQIDKTLKFNIDDLVFPLLVKPDDSFSGRGVTKINDSSDDLEMALKNAFKHTRSESVTVEEFMEGSLHSHSAFIQNNTIALEFFVDEFCTVYPYQVNCSNHPSALSKKMKVSIRNAISKLVDLLKLNNGLIHTQVIVNKDRFWLVECMRRCPGDLYGRLVEYSTGIDYSDLYLKSFIGEKLLPPKNTKSENKYYGRHTISSDKPLPHYTFTNNIPSKKSHIVPLKMSGKLLKEAPYDKLAILFIEFHNEKEMVGLSPHLEKYIEIESHKEKFYEKR